MSHSDPDWLPQVLPSYDFEAEADAIERAEAKEDERMTEAAKQVAPLEPPDFKRCQAERRIYQPFVMGGRVRRTERCEAEPVFIAVEIKPGKDGRCGAMSLCFDCTKVMMESADLRQRVQLQPIERAA